MKTDLEYYLAVMHLPNVATRTLQYLIATFGNIQSVFTATASDLTNAGCNDELIQAIQNPNWHAVERAQRWEESDNTHHLLACDNPAYPSQLKQITDPPHLLFVAGNLKALANPQIAIVGARHASPMGCENATQFAHHLAQSGFTITSGMALGIDGASHRGALNAKGITIAVIGTGINRCYPAPHRQLMADILANQGAIVSEFSLDMPPIAYHFPRRNRIISGLSLGILVVEAAQKSGSMITVKFALEQGRDIFAIPGSIHNPLAKGCHSLIRQGAKLAETAQDIVEELINFLPKKDAPTLSPTQKSHLNPEFEAILATIGYEMTPIDMILCRGGLTLSQVSSILLKLELEGYIQSVLGGYIRLAKK